MPHPLVIQWRFTRREFQRGLEGLGETEARHRFLPMNSISWNIGQMAWQEQRYWLTRLQGRIPLPHLNDLVGNGQPACTPSLAEMWEAGQTITHLADPFLEGLTTQQLQEIHSLDDQQTDDTAGNLLQRVIYHYRYHTCIGYLAHPFKKTDLTRSITHIP
jgi:hypothetical protein